MEAMYERKKMSPNFKPASAPYKGKNNKTLNQQIENLSFGLEEIILLRELDKRFTHANPRIGKCTMKSCNNYATYWLTRNNLDYCQSDMVCNQHANIWMQVKDLISESSLNRN
jgi:hypothetical protein